MTSAPLARLPDHSRVWLFGLSEPLDAGSRERVSDRLAGFLDSWTAHRAELRSGAEWIAGRFLLIGVDETAAAASGCSIDALLRELRDIEATTGCELLNGDRVFYRDPDGSVRSVSRPEFRDLAAAGEVDRETRVFDLTIDRLGRVREGGWEVEAGGSWHARLL